VAPGEVVFEGIGFPNGDRRMIMAYWMAEKVSSAMQDVRTGG
jgi:hypothetical protein